MLSTYNYNTQSRLKEVIMYNHQRAARMKSFNSDLRNRDASVALKLGQHPLFVELYWLDGCGEPYMISQGFSKKVIDANKAAILNDPNREATIRFLKERHGV